MLTFCRFRVVSSAERSTAISCLSLSGEQTPQLYLAHTANTCRDRVYFLQILDKSCVGYAATFGLREDAVSPFTVVFLRAMELIRLLDQNLTGDQYSTIGSAGYWAQLAWQPFSAYLIVKVPPRILMPVS